MAPGSSEGQVSRVAGQLTPHGCGLPAAAADLLECAGFGVTGVLRASDYDALVPTPWRCDAWLPGARSALVLGTGGGRFEAAWRASHAGESDPIDRYAREVMAHFTQVLGETTGDPEPPAVATQLYCDRRAVRDERPVFADFVALARACGLGAPGRLGLLIHPEFGPWWSVRAVALTRLELSPTAGRGGADGFDPCDGCAAPCQTACPAAAVGPGGLDGHRCAAHRLAHEACAARCDARRACPIGRAHAFAPEDEAVYAAASLAWIRDEARGGGAGRP